MFGHLNLLNNKGRLLSLLSKHSLNTTRPDTRLSGTFHCLFQVGRPGLISGKHTGFPPRIGKIMIIRLVQFDFPRNFEDYPQNLSHN